ncbi:MAG: hypothetical protein K2K74_02400, partial [Lachnospiraceae bacterium]|nr:hypothetical protein [Lachnospiraceae bacterium]
LSGRKKKGAKQSVENTVPETHSGTVQRAQLSESEDISDTEVVKTAKKQKKQRKSKQLEQTLDTSQLLKKKDDRNV